MAFYKNQSDMFNKRAESCKKNGDRFYAQAMKYKEQGEINKYEDHIALSQSSYKMQKENELSAKEHTGKTW